MRQQEKKQQRIYDLLNVKTKPMFICLPFRKQRHFFYKNSFDYAIWGVLKTKQMQLPIEILLHLRLLFKRNGIKCQKNLF